MFLEKKSTVWILGTDINTYEKVTVIVQKNRLLSGHRVIGSCKDDLKKNF